MKLIIYTTFFFILSLSQAAIAQTPVSTAFTYQGQLKQSGSPVNAGVNMAFGLWDAVTLGTQQGTTLTFDGAGGNPPPVNVSNGLFVVQLEFGVNPYTANQGRWLEITVNGQPLSPRQLLSPTPFALNTRGVNVSAAGNIGIGTASPAAKLHLSDPARAPESRTNGDGLMVDNEVWGANSIYQSGNTFLGRTYWNGDSVGRPDWTLDTRNVAKALVVNGNNGNVGIGTAAPANKLEVTAGSNGDGIRLTGSTAPLRSPGFHLHDSSTQRGTLGLAEGAAAFSSDAAAGDVVLRANTGKLLLQNGIGASGLTLSGNNVGIGTTTPTQRLDVAGNMFVSGSINVPITTRYLTISGSTFVNSNSNADYSSFDNYVYAVTSGNSTYFRASVQLPNGATVTELRALVLDNDPTLNMSVIMQRINLTTGVIDTFMALVSTSGSSASPVLITDTSIVNAIVDNQNYAYQIMAEWTVPSVGSNIRFYCVRLAYTIDTVGP